MMEKNKLVEKHAARSGHSQPSSSLDRAWRSFGDERRSALRRGGFHRGGPTRVPHAVGPNARFRKGHGRCRDDVAADVPEYARGNLKKLEDFTDADKIAVTAIKVSIPAIVMQMYAAEKYGLPEATRFDKYTVSMTHPDGVVALLGGSGAISAHFTSPPFHQRERKDSGSPYDHDLRRCDEGIHDLYDAVDHDRIPREESQSRCGRACGA